MSAGEEDVIATPEPQEEKVVDLMAALEASVAAAMRCIEKHHSYEVPEILAVPVTDGLSAYLQWLARESGGPQSE